MEWSIIWEYRGALWEGFLLTAKLSVVSCIGSFVVGAVIGCVGVLPAYLPQRLAAAYVESLRNVPVIVKLLILYYAIGLDALTSCYIGLILHSSAYIADVISAGFRTIPREQLESARATGLSYSQAFFYIQLPQALRIVIPPLTSQFIEVVKNTAVVMLIGVAELTYQAQRIEYDTFRGFEAITAITVLYLLIALFIAGVMSLLEKRFGMR